MVIENNVKSGVVVVRTGIAEAERWQREFVPLAKKPENIRLGWRDAQIAAMKKSLGINPRDNDFKQWCGIAVASFYRKAFPSMPVGYLRQLMSGSRMDDFFGYKGTYAGDRVTHPGRGYVNLSGKAYAGVTPPAKPGDILTLKSPSGRHVVMVKDVRLEGGHWLINIIEGNTPSRGIGGFSYGNLVGLVQTQKPIDVSVHGHRVLAVASFAPADFEKSERSQGRVSPNT